MKIKEKLLRITDKKRYTAYKQIVQQKEEYSTWVTCNYPLPPPHIVKQLIVNENAKANNVSILVETGTFQGDMVNAMLSSFSTIYSVELSVNLHVAAKERFKLNSNVELFQGDSSVVLPQLLSKIAVPCLFWLDGHYSGGVTAKGKAETPVLSELKTIVAHSIQNHIILIDDARLFNGTNDYPTINELSSFVSALDSKYTLEVYDDIIFLKRNKLNVIHSKNSNFLKNINQRLRDI